MTPSVKKTIHKDVDVQLPASSGTYCDSFATTNIDSLMNQPITISVGIDWADAKHDFQLISPDGQIHAGVFDQNPKAIADQIAAWRKLCPGPIFAVAIEATKGAIVNALLEFDDVHIYPVNPAAMANYRRAFAHGGGKNDPVDAKLLRSSLITIASSFNRYNPTAA